MIAIYNPQLETFIRVADAGSFTKAAESAYITTTAVIKQINILESNLRVQLFKRTHRGLTLTKAGESLYKDAKYIIQYCNDSIARLQTAMANDINIIYIGTSPMTPAKVLVKLWPEIHKRCPDIKFQLVPFENTLENAKEILRSLGKNIDIVIGIFDNAMLKLRRCEGLELLKTPICCAVSVNHRLANRNQLKISDLYNETFMMMHRGWSSYVDNLRDYLYTNHPQINLVDFDFYDVKVFNQCENSNNILMVVNNWENVHPLLKIISVDWDYDIPFGILHSPKPSQTVKRLLYAIQDIVIN